MISEVAGFFSIKIPRDEVKKGLQGVLVVLWVEESEASDSHLQSAVRIRINPKIDTARLSYHLLCILS